MKPITAFQKGEPAKLKLVNNNNKNYDQWKSKNISWKEQLILWKNIQYWQTFSQSTRKREKTCKNKTRDEKEKYQQLSVWYKKS